MNLAKCRALLCFFVALLFVTPLASMSQAQIVTLTVESKDNIATPPREYSLNTNKIQYCFELDGETRVVYREARNLSEKNTTYVVSESLDTIFSRANSGCVSLISLDVLILDNIYSGRRYLYNTSLVQEVYGHSLPSSPPGVGAIVVVRQNEYSYMRLAVSNPVADIRAAMASPCGGFDGYMPGEGIVISGDTISATIDTVIASTQNFANSNLVFDSNRVHDLNGFSMSIEGATNRVRFGSTDINSTGAQGWFSVGLDALEGTGTLSNARFFRTASGSYLGASVIGDLAPIGMTPMVYLRYLGDNDFGGGSGKSYFLERVMIDTLTEGITFARVVNPGANPAGNIEVLYQHGNGVTGDSVSVWFGTYARKRGSTIINNYSGEGTSELIVQAETNDKTPGAMGQLNFRIGDVQKNQYKKLMFTEGGLLFFDNAIPYDAPPTGGISYEPPSNGDVLVADGDSGVYRPQPISSLVGQQGLWYDRGHIRLLPNGAVGTNDTIQFVGYISDTTVVTDSVRTTVHRTLVGKYLCDANDDFRYMPCLIDAQYWQYYDSTSERTITESSFGQTNTHFRIDGFNSRSDYDSLSHRLEIDNYRRSNRGGNRIASHYSPIDSDNDYDAAIVTGAAELSGSPKAFVGMSAEVFDGSSVLVSGAYLSLDAMSGRVQILPLTNTGTYPEPTAVLTTYDTLGTAEWITPAFTTVYTDTFATTVDTAYTRIGNWQPYVADGFAVSDTQRAVTFTDPYYRYAEVNASISFSCASGAHEVTFALFRNGIVTPLQAVATTSTNRIINVNLTGIINTAIIQDDVFDIRMRQAGGSDLVEIHRATWTIKGL